MRDKMQSRLILPESRVQCCYCGGENHEFREVMIVEERHEGKDLFKVMMKFKNQDIYRCADCKRHFLILKQKV